MRVLYTFRYTISVKRILYWSIFPNMAHFLLTRAKNCVKIPFIKSFLKPWITSLKTKLSLVLKFQVRSISFNFIWFHVYSLPRVFYHQRLIGLVVWFLLWVQEAPCSIHGWAQFFFVVEVCVWKSTETRTRTRHFRKIVSCFHPCLESIVVSRVQWIYLQTGDE